MPKKISKILLSIVLPCCLLLLSACQEESLYQDLSERQATKILRVLNKHGIESNKLRVQSGQKATYTVQVAKDKINNAIDLLEAYNLPREKLPDPAKACGAGDLIKTPDQEKCIKTLVKTNQLISMLEDIQDGIKASVILSLPDKVDFEEEQEKKKPTASAVIRIKRELVVDEDQLREARLQRLIASGVEGMDPLDVTVQVNIVDADIDEAAVETPESSEPAQGENAGNEIAAIPLTSLVGLRLHPDSVKRFKLYAAIMLVLLMAVSAVLILNVIKLTKMRQELKVLRSQSGAGFGGDSPPMLQEADGEAAPQLEAPSEKSAPPLPGQKV